MTPNIETMTNKQDRLGDISAKSITMDTYTTCCSIDEEESTRIQELSMLCIQTQMLLVSGLGLV